MPTEDDIVPFKDLPDDAPIYHCEICTYRCQPIELQIAKIPHTNCPHCNKPMKLVTKLENLDWREQNYGVRR